MLDPRGQRQGPLVENPVLGVRIEPDSPVHQGRRDRIRQAELGVVRSAWPKLRLARLADDRNLAGGHPALDPLDRLVIDAVLATKGERAVEVGVIVVTAWVRLESHAE